MVESGQGSTEARGPLVALQRAVAIDPWVAKLQRPCLLVRCVFDENLKPHLLAWPMEHDQRGGEGCPPRGDNAGERAAVLRLVTRASEAPRHHW